MTKESFIQAAKAIADSKTAYLYGGTGEKITESVINSKAAQYPKWYTASRIKKLKGCIGYRGFDCSGLIKGIFKDAKEPMKDLNADSIFSTMCIKESKPEAGYLAHKKGHIAIVIDSDHIIEASSSAGKVKISDISSAYEFGRFTLLNDENGSVSTGSDVNRLQEIIANLQAIIEKYGGKK